MFDVSVFLYLIPTTSRVSPRQPLVLRPAVGHLIQKDPGYCSVYTIRQTIKKQEARDGLKKLSSLNEKVNKIQRTKILRLTLSYFS